MKKRQGSIDYRNKHFNKAKEQLEKLQEFLDGQKTVAKWKK
jgi:hypothetical protein